jgi:hypothetical protein
LNLICRLIKHHLPMVNDTLFVSRATHYVKAFMILLLATGTLNAADIKRVGPDIRVVSTTHVDLAPIHKWADGGEKNERPMKHWKIVKVETIQTTAPWPTCYIQIDRGEHKSVYTKNIPADLSQFLTELNTLDAQTKALTDEVESDRSRLKVADAINADYNSEFNYNRNNFRINLGLKEDRLAKMNTRLNELKSTVETSTTDLAMFTGQIYNKIEVWDFGTKQ